MTKRMKKDKHIYAQQRPYNADLNLPVWQQKITFSAFCCFSAFCFFSKRIQKIQISHEYQKKTPVTVGKVLVATQNTSEMAVELLCVDACAAAALAKLNRVAL